MRYIPMGVDCILWSSNFSEGSLTHISALFALNHAINSEETALRYFGRMYHLLQPGGKLLFSITDSDTICKWKKSGSSDQQIHITGELTCKWGSMYTINIAGGVQEYLIPHNAILGVARQVGFVVDLNVNHASLRRSLKGYCSSSEAEKMAVDDQMDIPTLYRAMVMHRPKARTGTWGKTPYARHKT